MSDSAALEWQSRIVGTADVDPTPMIANPDNWRIHPLDQRVNLRGQSRHAMGDAAVRPQRAHGRDADADGHRAGQHGRAGR